VWRWEWREDQAGGGKWTKVPYVARQAAAGIIRQAKTNDSRSWSDFDKAVKAYRAGGWEGIGFVFSKDDPYCGVDLDDCRDPRTGDLDPWAVDLVAAMGGYAEISPSGTGVKVIVKAVKPAGRSKGKYESGEVEVYDRGRYFALTGLALPDSLAEVTERQEQLETVYCRVFGEQAAAAHRQPGSNGRCGSPSFRARVQGGGKPYDQLTDDDLLQLAGAAKNAAKFRALWDGDTSGHGGDDSKADAALCAILAYWCRRDANRMDRLFRRSGLMRPKWDERHRGDGATYGQVTIEFALSVCADVYPGPQPGRSGRGSQAPPPTNRPDDPEAEPLDSVQTILAHWLERYKPVFKRGKEMYSKRLGRWVSASEACYAPSSELVTQLLFATDAPEGGKEDIPKHFRDWAKTAWVDLLDKLWEEEIADNPVEKAREEFRKLVREALLKHVVVGYTHRGVHPETGKEVEITDTQRRPLIVWAEMFAGKGKDGGERDSDSKLTYGRWGDIRGYRLWSRLERGETEGECDRIRVALRVELFAQIPVRELARMSQSQFTSLAHTYGVGKPVHVRGGDLRAVELDPDFLADVLDSPANEEPDAPDGREPSRPRTCEEQASERQSKGQSHA
ncbi:MAG TPA: hypothetical protein VEL76_41760, partial [Gemmataceae bacterium]|nr:hypothetical protein [Gemmataceae bacterium]